MGVLFFLLILFVGGIFGATAFETASCHKSKCWHKSTFTALMFSFFILLANLSWFRLYEHKYNFTDVISYMNYLSITAKSALLSFITAIILGTIAGFIYRLLKRKYHFFRD
jgi:uncharacterized membrane protein YeaQ/YmgE (transglycosylase-associated protein family)